MAYYQSPGVYVVEKDFSTIVPGVSTTIGGIVGDFAGGPLNTPKLVTSQNELISVFGYPNASNSAVWWTAASFLQYTNKLYVVNVGSELNRNAVASGTSAINVMNDNDFINLTTPEKTATGGWIAKVDIDASRMSNDDYADNQYLAGNDRSIMVIDASTWSKLLSFETANLLKFPLDSRTNDPLLFSTVLLAANGNKQPNKTTFASELTNINQAVIKDEVFVIGYSKTTFQILDFAVGLSKFSDATTLDPTDPSRTKKVSAYYKDYINNFFSPAYCVGLPATSYEAATVGEIFDIGISSTLLKTNDTKTLPNLLLDGNSDIVVYTLGGAVGDAAIDDSMLKTGYDMFANKDDIDVSLILTANYSDTVVLHALEQVAFPRKDAIVFASLSTGVSSAEFPMKNANGVSSGRGPIGTVEGLMTQRNLIAASDSNGLASFLFIDSGFKRIIDRYQRGAPLIWVPLNGDTAGLCARAEYTNDAWWSPAGFNRGGILNCIKVSFNPNAGQRDLLYSNQINPVVTFPGQGTILYGDKTAQNKPSVFDRINVRRLFIVLEKAIAEAAKYSLFEFNDSFTRNQFKNMIEPFLRDVQGRRGIYEFLVVCDTTNNTGEVIDRNEFIADIYIKPARSINFIQLNFVASKSGVDFSTLFGG
jgi:hypothetical protein